MATNHSVHAMMVGMSESWWRSGIMPCLRSDVDRDKPVAYIFWVIEGPNGPMSTLLSLSILWILVSEAYAAGESKLTVAMLRSATQTPFYVAVESGLYNHFGLNEIFEKYASSLTSTIRGSRFWKFK